MRSKLEAHIAEHQQVIATLAKSPGILKSTQDAIAMIMQSLKEDGQILFCGNGGSAADSEHLAAELSGRFKKDRPPLNAEALHVNGASLTAIANDFGYSKVFERILEAKAKKGDVLWCLTTSGNSENVMNALSKANDLGLSTLLMTGDLANKTVPKSDIHIQLPSTETARIQEAMMLIGHIICEEVEEQYFPS